MWPFRPERLSDVIPKDDLRRILLIGDDLGSAVTLIERLDDETYQSIDPARAGEEGRADPFCTYFRHGKVGGKTAFNGADEACAACEQRFARRLFQPGAAPLAASSSGVVRLRCHMGLTDYQVPVKVGEKVIASVIAGRRVESEDDRQRIRKVAGKIGKLTRAEAEIADSGDRLIVPAEEKARDRLVQEISAIPLRAEELERKLAELGKLLGRLGSRLFESLRREREDSLIERIDFRQGDLPRQFADLRRETSALLDAIRVELQLEYLAFFSVTPKELDDPDARASLVAESGLGASTARRILELDWSKFPPPPAGGGADVGRGLAAVSAAIHAFTTTRDTPEGLKDRLLKCLFLAPVELGSHLRSALAFGPSRSGTRPEPGDLQFLARIARAVSRRYYALAAELERRWLADHLEQEGSARKDAEAAKRQLEKTEGFAFFDARKLANQCLERAGTKARERGVELDTRELIERLILRGDRQQIGDLFRRLLEEGIERTFIDPETKKGAPLRVFLKRTRTRLLFGVEAIGDFLGSEARRSLFARAPVAGDRTASPSPAEPSRRSLGAEMDVVRRHEGRLRVDSERLHRREKERERWIGRTAFIVDLPLPARPDQKSEEPAAPGGAEAESRAAGKPSTGSAPALASPVEIPPVAS